MIERSQRKLVGWCMPCKFSVWEVEAGGWLHIGLGVSGKSEILMHKDQTKQSAKQ